VTGAGIVVEGVQKTYRGGKTPALDDVSLAIRSGECFGVIGPNGAGKTTLMGCLLGFLKPDAGRITIEGSEPDDLAVRSVTGYLPERLNFDLWMTGRAFLAHHHRLARQPKERRQADTEEALHAVGMDPAAWDQVLRRYSRGMLQRLGFAQAIIGKPRVLFLDEPTSGMDPLGVVMIRRIVDQMKADGVTIVLNSHQLEQVERFCDRVAYVRAGRVESVEVLTAGAQVQRILRVRTAGDPPDAAAWTKAGESVGAEFLGYVRPWARFSVASDEAAADLVAKLVRSHIRVMEAVPEESRLERLFFSGQGAAS